LAAAAWFEIIEWDHLYATIARPRWSGITGRALSCGIIAEEPRTA
jgi:hypothetical protein